MKLKNTTFNGIYMLELGDSTMTIINMNEVQSPTLAHFLEKTDDNSQFIRKGDFLIII